MTELHYSAFTIDSNIEENSSEDVKVKARLFGYRKRVFFFAGIFGLLQKDPEEWFGGGISDADKALAEEYDVVRAKAMEAKQVGDKAAMGEAFKKSDAIRDQISAKGLVLETSADGKSSLRKA